MTSSKTGLIDKITALHSIGDIFFYLFIFYYLDYPCALSDGFTSCLRTTLYYYMIEFKHNQINHDYLKKPIANKSGYTKYCCVP